MTCDDVIKISRKWLSGLLTGLLVAMLLAMIFWPRVVRLSNSAETELTGVPDDFIERYQAVCADYPEPFQSVAEGVEQQDNTAKNVRLFEAVPSLNPGPQQTGDCVSWGQATSIYVRAAITALKSGVPPPSSQVFPPHQYGLSRVQIGNGRPPCRSAGAYPSDAIRGFKQFGYVTTAEVAQLGFNYSGRLADDWGCNGPPRNVIELGKRHAGGDAYPIRSIEEWRDAICNVYPVTVAIPWRPGKVYRGHDGRSCIAFDGSNRAFDGSNRGGHQICSLAYDGSSGKPYWLLFNSHGANWPSGASRADGTPPGSVWVDERWARWIVTNGELWAISDVPGFEAEELDLRIFDDVRVSLSERN